MPPTFITTALPHHHHSCSDESHIGTASSPPSSPAFTGEL
jgi:hypothetical protein